MTRSARRLEPLLYALVAVLASAPAWIVAYPPVQDLAYHLATIRVIHSLHDPAYGLGDFVLTLGNTQYVGYYLLADGLAYLLGVKGANTLLVAAYFAGTVLGLRALLRALGNDPRLCLFALPLLANRMFFIGLLPFLLGVPVLFFALAGAVSFVQRPSLARGAAIACGALALFFLHVVPFGLFVIGFLAMVFARPWRAWAALASPLGPAALAMLWWLSTTAGNKRFHATSTDNVGFVEKVKRIPYWLADNFVAGGEGWILLALAVLAAVAIALALRDDGAPPIERRFERGLALVPLACVSLYFGTVERQEYLWPIAGRFPSLCLLTAIPLLRMPIGRRGIAVASSALALGGLSLGLTCARFVQFQRDELGDLPGAIANIPPRMHVAAILGGSRSTILNTKPLLHAGSYYQLEKGGGVAFTFAGYPHWPIAFKVGAEPPTGPAFPTGWEWQTHTTSELSSYYDYVITRGVAWGGPEYTLQFSDPSGWRVWRRTAPPDVAASQR